MRLEGVFVATVSPFEEAGSLDLASFEKHLDWLVSAGVHGLVPCGTTGEGPTLTTEERALLIQASVRIAKAHGLKVIPGCGGNNTLTALSTLETAAKLGADAGLVVTPYYNKPTQRGLIAHYQFLAEKSPIPLVLYNVPGRTAVNLSVETVTELWKHPKIIGIKEASGNHAQWLALAGALEKKEKAFLSGDDDAFATVLSLGGSGIISATANVAPKHFVDIWNLSQKGQWQSAFELQTKLNPLVKAMFLETNPAPIKYALSVLGKGKNSLRLPLVSVERKTEEEVIRTIRSLE